MFEYRIYEVYPDGILHDTGKAIKYNNHYLGSREIIRLVLDSYGFDNNQYDYYYITDNLHCERTKIKYNYLSDGFKDTWVLIKEENNNNKKEDDNE